MPITETLMYFAGALKVTAVPAGVLDLLEKEKRNAIELWLEKKWPKLIKKFGITLLVLYFSVFLLVEAGPYLVLFYFLFNRLIGSLVLFLMDEKESSRYLTFVYALLILSIIAAILEKWILPESWVLAIAYPFEVFSVWVNGIPYVNWVLPDYSGKGFLEHFRQVFLCVEDWLWSWLAFLSWGYFFVARGFMLVIVVLIQILFFLSIILGFLLALGLPLHLLLKFSDCVKHILRFEKGRIPVGAFILWAIGETLEFALKTQEYFQKCGYKLFH